MKRVVTGVNGEGRSYIVSVDELDTSTAQKVWDYEPGHIREWIEAIDPAMAADWVGPEVPGGTRIMFAPLPPDSEMQYGELPGIDESGFHTTRTIDFDFLVDGELTLVVDEGSVDIETGDIVIQQATRHAWRNSTDRPAVLLAVIHRPEGV
jgi:hypothetical protein